MIRFRFVVDGAESELGILDLIQVHPTPSSCPDKVPKLIEMRSL